MICLFALGDLPCHEPLAARDELLRVARLGLRGAIVHQLQGAEPSVKTSRRGMRMRILRRVG